MGHARALLSVESIDDQILLAKEVTDRSLSVRETEQLVKRGQAAPTGQPRAVSGVISNTEDPNVLAAEAKLSKKLGAPVKIRFAKLGGHVEIRFSSSEDLSRLFDALMQSHY